jgi:hypothetical protein
MAVKKRLCARHYNIKMLTRFCAENDAWKRLPIAFFIFINQVPTYVAVLSSARLRPKAMQYEVVRVEAVGRFTHAL